jgi:hypothetical protein
MAATAIMIIKAVTNSPMGVVINSTIELSAATEVGVCVRLTIGVPLLVLLSVVVEYTVVLVSWLSVECVAELIAVTVEVMAEAARLAVIVTGLLGIVNVHGLLDAPPEHEAPTTVQPWKTYPWPVGLKITWTGEAK